MDCSSVSAAERVPDCGEGVQWPKDKNPIFFITLCPDNALRCTYFTHYRVRINGVYLTE
jgi:hypothetical protein